MTKNFERILPVLLEYLGDFMEDPRVIRFIQDAGKISWFLPRSVSVPDYRLENIAAAGDGLVKDEWRERTDFSQDE